MFGGSGGMFNRPKSANGDEFGRTGRQSGIGNFMNPQDSQGAAGVKRGGPVVRATKLAIAIAGALAGGGAGAGGATAGGAAGGAAGAAAEGAGTVLAPAATTAAAQGAGTVLANAAPTAAFTAPTAATLGQAGSALGNLGPAGSGVLGGVRPPPTFLESITNLNPVQGLSNPFRGVNPVQGAGDALGQGAGIVQRVGSAPSQALQLTAQEGFRQAGRLLPESVSGGIGRAVDAGTSAFDTVTSAPGTFLRDLAQRGFGNTTNTVAEQLQNSLPDTVGTTLGPTPSGPGVPSVTPGPLGQTAGNFIPAIADFLGGQVVGKALGKIGNQRARGSVATLRSFFPGSPQQQQDEQLKRFRMVTG